MLKTPNDTENITFLLDFVKSSKDLYKYQKQPWNRVSEIEGESTVGKEYLDLIHPCNESGRWKYISEIVNSASLSP